MPSDGGKPKLRVVIVDDSAICRAALRHQLEHDGDIEIVGEGESAFAAIDLVAKHKPDLVTMDVQMPGKSGLEAVEQIMSRLPTPIIVVTAESLADEAGVAFRAIENGALDIVPKPAMTDEDAAIALRALVRRLAKTPVFQRLEERGPSTKPATSGVQVELIVIGAGGGGMGSVLGLLGRIPSKLRCPIVIYQPLASELVASYARYLGTSSKQDVVVVRPPEHALVNGQIALVPGLRATIMNRTVLRAETAHPSLDALLRSVADVYGARAAGIILGGEEDASLHGLRALRDAGATTMVELVRRPGVEAPVSSAVSSGAAEAECRLEEIADWLIAAAAF